MPFKFSGSVGESAAPKDGEDESFFGTVGKNIRGAGDMVAGLGPGLFGFGQDLVRTAEGISEIAPTFAHEGARQLGADDGLAENVANAIGMLSPVNTIGRAVTGLQGNAKQAFNEEVIYHNNPDDRRGMFERWVPAIAKMERSFEDTAVRGKEAADWVAKGDVQDVGGQLPASVLAPVVGGFMGLRDAVVGSDATVKNPYVEAAQRGELAPIVVEDAGNVALGAQIAGEGLNIAAQSSKLRGAVGPAGVSRLEAVARQVGTGADVANAVAGAPFLPYKAAVGAVGKTKFVQEATKRREVRGWMGRQIGARAGTEIADTFAPAMDAAVALLPDAAEQQAAMTLVDRKVNPENIDAIEAMVTRPVVVESNGVLTTQGAPGPELMQQRLSEWAPDLTLEGLGVMRRYVDGTDPDLVARLDEAVAVTAPMRDVLAGTAADAQWDGRLQDYGTKGLGALTDEAADNLAARRAEAEGTGPMFMAIDAAFRDPVTAMRKGRLSSKDSIAIRKATDDLTDATADLKYARDPIEAGDAQIRIDRAESRLAGIREKLADDPMFAPPNQRTQLMASKGLRSTMRKQADLLRQAGDDKTADQLTGFADELAVKLSQIAEPASGHLIGGMPSEARPSFAWGRMKEGSLTRELKTEKLKVGHTAERGVQEQGIAIAKERYEAHKNAVVREWVLENGRKVDDFIDVEDAAAWADENGFTPFDPVNLGKPLKAEDITPDTYMIPNHGLKAISDQQKWTPPDDWFGAVVKGNDAVLRNWKMWVLPLSPKWNTGNLVGNAMMAATQAGTFSPSTVRLARELLHEPTFEARQVLGQGFFENLREHTDVVDDAFGHLEEVSRLRKIAEAVPNAGYKGNQWIDDMGHLLVYSAKLLEGDRARAKANKLYQEGRISKEWRDEMHAKAPTPEQAIELSLKVAGDFKNMTKVQREGVRRVVPFFPWYRHITELVWKMPLENPYRVAWTLHLSEMGSEGQEERPDWLRGGIETGEGTYARMPWNPFPTGADSPLFTPDALAGSMTPLVQWPMAARGWNMGRGRATTKAPGDDGKTEGTLSPGQFAGYMSSQLPQSRMVLDTVGERTVRYDTREPMFGAGGKPLPDTRQDVGPVPAPVFEFLTGVTFDQPDLKAQEKRTKSTKRTGKKSQARYEKSRQRHGV